MKIDKSKITEVFKQQLVMRKQTMTDEAISESIDEAQAMYDQTKPFIKPNMHPIQHIIPSFLAGIQFALDSFKRGTMNLNLKTKDGGNNWDVSEAKCVNPKCLSTNLRASGDDLKCNDCNTSMFFDQREMKEIEPQVLLRLKNTDRTDILSALRVWKKQLNQKSKESADDLINYIDNAGSN